MKQNSDGWWRVDREHPCPVCRSDHWCTISPNGLPVCMRIESDHPTGNGGWAHPAICDRVLTGGSSSKQKQARLSLSQIDEYKEKSKWGKEVFDLVRHCRHDLRLNVDDTAARLQDWHSVRWNPPRWDVALDYAVESWNRSKYGTDADRLATACAAALRGDPAQVPELPRPKRQSPSTDERAALVYRVCYWLSSSEPDGIFFLPCPTASKLLGIHPQLLDRAVKRLVDSGVLVMVSKGDHFNGRIQPGETRRKARATRYRLQAIADHVQAGH